MFRGGARIELKTDRREGHRTRRLDELGLTAGKEVIDVSTRALIGLLALMAVPIGLRAEPYTTVLGDKKVTSVTRTPTKGAGISREELLKAARDAVPIIIEPTDRGKPDQEP
jgi:hypothetical protein